MSEKNIKQKLKQLGQSFVTDTDNIKGVEFILYFKDGTRVYYNSRDDEEVREW